MECIIMEITKAIEISFLDYFFAECIIITKEFRKWKNEKSQSKNCLVAFSFTFLKQIELEHCYKFAEYEKHFE